MKWNNKGHEFDECAKEYIELFHKKNDCIYIFGAGYLGKGLAPVFERYRCFEGYIDNDIFKQKCGVNGRNVISFQDYIEKYKKGMIIIAADSRNIPVVEGQLCAQGLVHGIDFWVYGEFMQKIFPVISVYYYGILYAELAQICLTERCTLKCRDCAHGCFAVDFQREDLSLAMAQKSADAFFSIVDLIREFVLIGGEPFLYRDLGSLIQYIGEKYRDKILRFSITTNGTILPDDHTLDLCRQYNVLVNISNYSGAITTLGKRYEQLIQRMEKRRVSYTLGTPDLQWVDYGFQTVDHGGEERGLIQVFDRCKTPCREIRGNKYYYCVMARSVSENLGFNIGEKDYLDIGLLREDAKKVFLEFDCGYSEKGYLEMCNHCNGAEAVKYPVPAAIQKGGREAL